MNLLVEIIESLPLKALKHLQRSFSNFKVNGTEDSKMKCLFILAVKTRKIDDGYYQKKIYGRENGSDFRTLKHRLKSHVLNQLISEDLTYFKSNIDSIDTEFLENQKLLYTARLLIKLNGTSTIAINLLTKIETKAKLYEHYQLLCDCLNLKKYNTTYTSPLIDFERINSELEFYQTTHKLVNKANDYYYKFILHPQIISKNNSNLKFTDQLLDAIHEIKTDLTYTKSPLSNYFLKMLEMEYFNLNKNFKAGLEVTAELTELVKNNPSVYKLQRLGSAYINSAFFKAKYHLFEESIRDTKLAISLTKEGSINFLIYSEILIQLLLYNGKQAEFAQTLNQCIEIAYEKHYILFIDRFKYYKAIQYYKSNKHKECLKLLSENSKLDNDKIGIGLYQKILKVLCLIKLKNFDSSDNSIESIMRTFSIHPEELKGNTRLALILQTLQSISNNGYHPLSYAKCSRRDHENQSAWEPLTIEPFPMLEELQSLFQGKKNKRSINSPS